MKRNRKIVALIIVLVIILNISIITPIPTYAHGIMLNVSYDDCADNGMINNPNNLDEIDEM